MIKNKKPNPELSAAGRRGIRKAAEFCKRARQGTRKSQARFAKDAGTSQNEIWRVESETTPRGPTVEFLARIAHAAGKELVISMLPPSLAPRVKRRPLRRGPKEPV